MKWLLGMGSLIFSFGICAQNLEEYLTQLDRGLVVERLRKAYAPVSVKLDGDWLITSSAGTETWKYANQKWKCEGSTIKCADLVPLSFRWFANGKTWLTQGEPVKKVSYDFQGSRASVAEGRNAAAPETEDHPAEAVVQFEGKRNALEVWEWNSPLASSLTVSLSLRDFLIERIKSNDGVESLEWAQRSGSKGLGLEKVFIDRGSERILMVRK